MGDENTSQHVLAGINGKSVFLNHLHDLVVINLMLVALLIGVTNQASI